MILKASQRGGAKQLGLHLLKRQEHEHLEVHEVRGFVSEDVIGALKEAHAVSKGTRCKQFLFSVSVNPPQDQSVSVEAFEDALSRIEAKTGLAGQPRVVVFHEKEGRRHMHAVWSRIDADSMTAIPLPHFKLKLRDVSRELYLEHGWKMPRGLANSREADPRNFTLAQWQQAKRTERSARDLKEALIDCWAISDSRSSFAQALRERGLMLARGDKRSHVAITLEGEVLSIARYTGKKSKDVRARLGAADDLPSPEQAKVQIAKEMTPVFRRLLTEAREQKRREFAPLEARRYAMAGQHRDERTRLDTAQGERWNRETRERAARISKGFKGIWHRITGEHARIRQRNEEEAFAALQRDRAQRQALIDAQLRERQGLQAQVIEARRRHAAQLAQLYRERESMRALDREIPPRGKLHIERLERIGREAEQTPAQRPPQPVGLTPHTRIETLRGAPQQAGQTIHLKSSFQNAADRLDTLRAGRTAQGPGRDRGPEPER